MDTEEHIIKGPPVDESTESSTKGESLTSTQNATGTEMFEDAKERIGMFREHMDDYVRKNPVKAVFVALGVGFIVGLMRRR